MSAPVSPDTDPIAPDPIGHVLRRLTFGPTVAQRNRFGSMTPDATIRALLDDGPLDVTPPTLDDDSDFWDATAWWLDVMRRPDAGLHERMVWFWHGHLTSSVEKSSPAAMLTQHGLLRRHALGNFRTLLQEITLDPAMLCWLDGAGSDVWAPNENYAREVMELFALGRDSAVYTEDDVQAGAKAFAGYWVDDENDNAVEFEPEAALKRPVQFLGRSVSTAAEAIDVICDQPACARHIAGRVHDYFIGAPPTPERLDSLTKVFRDSDLEIAPLVEEVVTHQSLLERPMSRPRTALEWFLAFERLVGTPLEIWTLEALGQMPLNPPNVAGWPNVDRWVSSGAVLTKAQAALDYSWDTETLDGGDPVAHVIERAGLLDVSEPTRTVLRDLVHAIEGRRERSSLLHAAMAMAPEFTLT